MFKRVMVAVVGIPALIFLLGLQGEGMTACLLILLCGIGARELMRAAAGKGGEKLCSIAALTAAMVPAVIYEEWKTGETGTGLLSALEQGRFAQLADQLPLPAALALAFVLLVFLGAILDYSEKERLTVSDVMAALFSGLCFPMMLSCLLLLRLEEHGELLVFVPLALSFGTDTLAFFSGLLLGKHKLTPVSPKKTVEGAVGGLLGGVLGLALVKLVAHQLLALSFLTWPQVLVLGLLGSAVCQIGDLSFSFIKREFGIKDYGDLIPGHGGVLDRFDSVTFVAPLVYLAVQIV